MDQRLRLACYEGKSESSGGLNIGPLRNLLVHNYPVHEDQIRSGPRKDVEAMCRGLLEKKPSKTKPAPAKTQPTKKEAPTSFAKFGELPLEVVVGSVLPQMSAKEARRYLMQDPKVLGILRDLEKCKYLTEQGAICSQKKVFNLPGAKNLNCEEYCEPFLCEFDRLIAFAVSKPNYIRIVIEPPEFAPFELEGTGFGISLIDSVDYKTGIHIRPEDNSQLMKISSSNPISLNQAAQICQQDLSSKPVVLSMILLHPTGKVPAGLMGQRDLELKGMVKVKVLDRTNQLIFSSYERDIYLSKNYVYGRNIIDSFEIKTTLHPR